MEDFVFSWGFEVVKFLRSFATPQLDMVMRVVTTLGSAPVFLLIVLVFFWCIDEKKGMRLGTVLLISVWCNLYLKLLLDMPRPFFDAYDPEIAAIPERLGGFPSGHAANSLVVYIILASWVKEKWQTIATTSKVAVVVPYIAATFLCLLIGFSRVYLGVHFPGDVVGGWFIAGLLLCAYFLLHGKIEALLVRGGLRAGMIACAAISFLMILNLLSKELLAPGGLMLGLGVGYGLNRRFIGFKALTLGSPEVPQFLKLTLSLRFVLGMAGFCILYFNVTKLAAVFNNSANYDLVVFIYFALVGLWVSAGAPWLFCKTKLAYKSVPQKEGQQP